MVTDKVYYKKNVNYNVGVRRFVGDADGVILTGADPFVDIKLDDLRAFKQANKRVIMEGLIVAAEEPSVDWETDNAISDEEISALVKNYLALKNRLPKVNSLPILYKLVEEARTQDRAKRIISLIQNRIDELEEVDAPINKEDMQGVD